MKKGILNVFVMFAMVLTATSCEKETMIEVQDLPAPARTFMTEHFPKSTVSHVKKERDGLGKEYSVYLSDGTEINFDKNGNWTEVDGAQNNPIPTGFISTPIVTYVKEKYPDTAITSIEKDRKNYEVELTNGLDLIFDSDGNFVRID